VGEKFVPIQRAECGIQAAILFFVLVILFPGVFLFGGVPAAPSILYEYPPWAGHTPPNLVKADNVSIAEVLAVFNNYNLLIDDALDTGKWPLWNPLQLTGAPLLANYQSMVFYPPRLLYRLFDNYTALTIATLLKLWLAGFTAYIYGRTLRLGVGASRFLSIGWMLSAFNMTWWHLPVSEVSPWLPVVMMGIEYTLDARYRKGLFTMTLGAALLLLAGHPETAFVMGVGAGLYFFLRLGFDRRRGPALWKPLGVASIAWATAIGFCAGQLVPFFEYLFNSSTFGGRVEGMERTPFLHGNAVISMFIPRFFGFTADANFWDARHWWENSNFVSLVYPGVTVWIALGAAGSMIIRDAANRRKCLAMIIPAILGMMLAADFFLVQALNDLPLLNAMWGIHHVAFAMFVLPVLAAFGVEWWGAHEKRPGLLIGPVVAFVIVFVISGIALSLYGVQIAELALDEYVYKQAGIALMFALIGVVLFISRSRIKNKHVFAALATFLLACDLLVAARSMRPVEPRAWLFPDIPFTTYLQQQPQPTRVSMSKGIGLVRSLRLGGFVHYGIEEAWGYEGLYPGRIVRFYKDGLKKNWNALEPVCAIPYYIKPFPDELPSDYPLELAATVDTVEIWRNPKAQPRAFLVNSITIAPNTNELFEIMCDPGFNPLRTVATDSPPDTPLPQSDSSNPGAATVVSRTATHVRVDVNAAKPSVLVLADQFFPGWKATIDSRSAEIFPAYHAFRGVVVPAGKHSVDFYYQPASFQMGIAVSSAACLLCILACAITLKKYRAA